LDNSILLYEILGSDSGEGLDCDILGSDAM